MPSELEFYTPNGTERPPEKEFVASYNFGPWYGGYDFQLPRSIDDNTAYLRIDLYEQMLLDAQVKASVNLLINGILGGGMEVLPTEESSSAKDVAKFVKDALLDELEQTSLLTEVLPDTLSAMAVGNKISEIVWNTPGESNLRIGGLKAWTIKKVKVKCRDEVAFYVDAFRNVIGIVGKVNPNEPPPPNTYAPYGFTGGFERVFPLEFYADQFAWLTWKPKDGDPRGTSDLRAAYISWWFKQQTTPEFLKFLATSAIPSIVLTLPPNAERRNKVKADGTTDTAAPTSATDEAIAAIKQFQNSLALVIANGSKIDAIQGASNEGRPFAIANGIWNSEIVKAITGQVAATDGDQTGRSPIVGQEIVNIAIKTGCDILGNYVRRFLAKPLVRKNYSRLVKVPHIFFPGMNKDDFLTTASGMSKLLLTGQFPPETWPAMYVACGLDAPSKETQDRMEKIWWEQKENEAKAPAIKSQLAGDGQNIQKRN